MEKNEDIEGYTLIDVVTFFKYLLHGILLSLVTIVLISGGVIFVLFLALLGLGGILLLLVMIYVLPALVGVANSIVTRFLWHGMGVTWLGVWIHGIILMILLFITNFLFITIPSWYLPSTLSSVITFIIVSFPNGYMGKYIARFWKERS